MLGQIQRNITIRRQTMLRKRHKVRIQRTIYLTKDIDTRLNKYLENCGYYKSDVFDMAIDKFLKEVENEENSSN